MACSIIPETTSLTVLLPKFRNGESQGSGIAFIADPMTAPASKTNPEKVVFVIPSIAAVRPVSNAVKDAAPIAEIGVREVFIVNTSLTPISATFVQKIDLSLLLSSYGSFPGQFGQLAPSPTADPNFRQSLAFVVTLGTYRPRHLSFTENENAPLSSVPLYDYWTGGRDADSIF
jgi:hypothetical protein